MPESELLPPTEAEAGSSLRLVRRNLPLPCLGLGLVRGIDPSSGTLYLLTPVPLDSSLRYCTVLARGPLQLPLVMLDLRTGGPNPYLSTEALSGDGASQLTTGRINIARRRGGGTE